MSERGVFAVDRGVWEHPSFDNEPLTQREAWVWLIGEASFKGRTKRIGSLVIELQRGQVAASLRFLADKWQWSEPRVRRFLKRLKTDVMIDAATDAGITVITICNYDKYQKVSLPRDVATDAHIDAGATQERRKVEDKEYKEKNAAGAASPEVELFRRGREVLGKQAGGLISQLLTAKQKNVALARAAIEQASTKDNPREYIGRVIRGPAKGAQPDWIDGIEGVL